jgi:predicted GTPase
VVVIGTPIDLTRIIKIDKPTARVTYKLQEIGDPNLAQLVGEFIRTKTAKRG